MVATADGRHSSSPVVSGERQEVEDQQLGVEAVLVAGDLLDALRDLHLAVGRLGHADLVDGQRDERRAVLDGERDDDVGLRPAGLEVDRVDDRAPGDLVERLGDHVGLGGVDLDRRRLGQRDALGDLAHLLVLVGALGQRDAEVEHVRAALDLVLGDLDEPVVVVGEQQLLGLARALRVDALADQRRAGVLDERRRGDHRRHARRARRGAGGDLVRPAALGDGVDVRRRRAAAASDDRHAVALDELAERRGERRGLLGEDRLAVGALDREAGVRDAGDRHGAELAEEADRVAHVVRTRGAVQADGVDLERLERRERRVDVGAQEHLAAVGQQRDRDLDRHRAPDRPERLARAEDRGLGLEDVLDRLDDDQVHAAEEQAAGLLLEDLDELAERHRAQRRVVGGGQEAGRAHRPGDEALVAAADRVAGDLRGDLVDLERVLAETPLVELEAAGLEGVRLHDLGAGGGHGVVHARDDVGAVEDQRLVALARQSAVVLGGQVELLERGTHAAVEDDDPLANGLGVVPHCGGSIQQP